MLKIPRKCTLQSKFSFPVKRCSFTTTPIHQPLWSFFYLCHIRAMLHQNIPVRCRTGNTMTVMDSCVYQAVLFIQATSYQEYQLCVTVGFKILFFCSIQCLLPNTPTLVSLRHVLRIPRLFVYCEPWYWRKIFKYNTSSGTDLY